MNNVERGERAAAILKDTLVVEAFADIAQVIVQEWANCPVQEQRDELWYTLKGLERFQNYFEAAVSSGEFELAQQEGNQ